MNIANHYIEYIRSGQIPLKIRTGQSWRGEILFQFRLGGIGLIKTENLSKTLNEEI